MSTYADPLVDGATPMSAYEGQVWERSTSTGSAATTAAVRRTGRAPRSVAPVRSRETPQAGLRALCRREAVREPIRRAGDAIADKAMRPALGAATALLELVNDWALELNDPKNVEKLARKQGFELDSFTELRQQDLKSATGC
ncbi:hypothetical protein [Streptomyces sp. 061-3]|uniref:hypothetical protein n=1 Tax=Streptomyces sp. 061-3 TaxID=2789268 RepID=UPI003980D591